MDKQAYVRGFCVGLTKRAQQTGALGYLTSMIFPLMSGVRGHEVRGRAKSMGKDVVKKLPFSLRRPLAYNVLTSPVYPVSQLWQQHRVNQFMHNRVQR